VGLAPVKRFFVTFTVHGTAGWTAVLLGATLPYLLAFPVRRRLRRTDPRRRPTGIYRSILIAGTIMTGVITA
jgi:hypothetical protein